MALTTCKECGERVSSSAVRCPACGGKVPRFKWWLWVPIALVIIFLGYGMSIPEHEARARADRKACESKYLVGQVASLSECDRAYENALARRK